MAAGLRHSQRALHQRGADAEAALKVAERCQRLIQKKSIVHALSPFGRRVTVSIGMTMVSADSSLSRLIAEADRCLYLAKAAGRDRTQPNWAPAASVA